MTTCEKHGATYMAHHDDGSATCGRCYMIRAEELGVIKGNTYRKLEEKNADR